ncbi:MAG: hypothetical protein JNJ61_23920 [Anaerolineae bacterium]|nr:hypothetical protein [Anaerolineae bacterium]
MKLSDRQRFFASLLFFVVTLAVVVLSSSSRTGTAPVTTTPAQVLPLDPTVRANVQNAAELALPADQQETVREIQTLLDACPDFGDQRRGQMQQHIDWLLAPTTIPPDILLAIGANPVGRLMLGMATYTAVEWRLHGSSSDSCLLPIGRLVNTLVAANGETPDPAFVQ